MKLRADVRKDLGKVKHAWGTVVDGQPVEAERMPPAVWVEIEEVDGRFMMYRYGAGGEFAGDTWHESIEDAMEDAKYEYEIGEGDWQQVE